MLKTVLIGLGVLMCMAALPQIATGRNYATLGPGIWNMKITNPTDSGSDIAVRVYFNPNKDPWAGDMFYLGRDGISKTQPNPDKYLRPGESTDWIDIGEYMSSKPTFYHSTDDYLSSVFMGVIGASANTPLRLKIELSRTPEQQMSRTIDFNESRPTSIGYSTWFGGGPKLPTVGLMIPVSNASKYGVITLEEAAQQQLKWLEATGKDPKPIKYMWFISHQFGINLKNPSRLEEMQARIVHLLGHSNLTNYVADKKDLEYLKSKSYHTNPAKLLHREDEPQKTAAAIKNAGIGNLMRLISFGDEIDIDLKATPAQQDAAFVEYLKSKKFNPSDFILPENEARAAGKSEDEKWGFVHLGGPLTPQKPKLLYEAAVFRYELWTRELASDTQIYRKLYGNNIQTGANYSPHIPVWPDVRKWVNVFKDKGMTMPWSEDWWWQVPEVSPQVYGMVLATLRHAADYYKAPACFYTIPDAGPGAEHLLRMNYFALGNQIKVIDHFAIYHQAFGTCDYVEFAESKDKFPAIQRITDAVSRIDKRLYNARMRKAQTAILLSKVNDVWNTEDLLSKNVSNLYHATLNTDNHERKAIWLALRHSQIPVDVITDDDVAAGMLKSYKVLYLVGQELQDKAVLRLEKWIRSGGVLISSGGGGNLNQYRESNLAMKRLYSLSSESLVRSVRAIAPSEDLPNMNSIATVTTETLLSFPALCYRHNLTPVDMSSVIARFDDGSPAAVENKIGKGKAILLGFLPGMAYLRPAVTNRSGLAENYPKEIRNYIVHWAKDVKVASHVVTSDPLIEATLQESKLGAVVTLVSFKNNATGKVTVSFPGLPNATKVTSLAHGELNVNKTSNGPSVTLPVDQGDFLLVD